MENVKVEFTEQEISNLMVFLKRVDLKGGEVPAFLPIVQKLEQALGGGVYGE